MRPSPKPTRGCVQARAYRGGCGRRVTVAVVSLVVAFRNCCVADGVATHPPVEPVRSIAAVLSLPVGALDEGRLATVNGTVTLIRQFARQHPFMAIQSGDDAMFIDLRQWLDYGSPTVGHISGVGFDLGSVVQVTGTIEAGGFAPKLMASSVRVVGEAPMPDAPAAAFDSLFEGIDVAKRVTLCGTVQAVEERIAQESWTLIVWAAGHQVPVDLPKAHFPDRPAWLVDAEVNVIGVVGTFRNTRGEMVAPLLTVARQEDVVVTEPAPASPFDSEKMPLDAIARFCTTRRGGHRLCTVGTVSRAFPGKLFLFGSAGGLRVDLAAGSSAPELRSGDVVQVAGFVTMARGIAGLGSAEVRKIDTGIPPPPLAVDAAVIRSADEKLIREGVMGRPGNYDACLIRYRARLESVNVLPDKVELVLSDGPALISGLLPAKPDVVRAVRRLDPGSQVELTGIVQAELGDFGQSHLVLENPRSNRFDILLSQASDIVVLRSPPWWTARRLAVAVASLLAVVAATGTWLALLRREVTRQTLLAIKTASARRQDALEYEVSLRERNRLAADLHDTILQTVTGIGFQLHACEETFATPCSTDDAKGPTSSAQHLTAATCMVEHAVQQLRTTLWSLRTQPAEGMVFSAAVRDALARLGEGHPAHISVVIDDATDQLPAVVGGSLLHIIREAVHNSLLHASPHSIDVRVTIDTASDTVTASVADDGGGFVVGNQAGPAEGHFGLTGMRERAAELGGSFTVRAMPSAGTTVVVTAPLAGPPKKWTSVHRPSVP